MRGKNQIEYLDKLECVMFTAPWAGPSVIMEDIFNEIKVNSNTPMKIISIDEPKNVALAKALGVRIVPVFYLMYDGKPIKVKGGTCSRKELEDFINDK